MSNGNEGGRDEDSQESDAGKSSGPERGRREATGDGGPDESRPPRDQQGGQDRPDQRRGDPPEQGQPRQGGGQPRQGGGQRGQNQQGQPRRGHQQGGGGHQQGQPRGGNQRGQRRGGHQQGQRGRPGASPGQPRRQPGGHGGVDVGDVPWKSGLLNGVLTFVAAFIAIGVLLFVDIALSSSGSPTGGGMGGSTTGDAIFYAVGWIFFNAHFVDVAAAGQSVNLLSMLGGFTTIPTVVYYAVPAGLLFASGRSVGRKAGPTAANGQRAAAGASLLAGYLPLALVGSVVFTIEMGALGTTTSIGPDTTTAVLIAGLAYPVIFGGLGGYLSG